MNILYICGTNPNEVSTGARQRTHFLYEALKRLGNVRVCVVSEDRKWGKIERLFNMFTKEGEWPFKSEEKVRNELGIGNEKFDVVITRYMRNAGRFSAWKIAPLYIDVDDMPLQAFLSIGVRRIPFGLKTFCTRLVKWWQGYILKKCHGVWVCKMEDAKILPYGLRYGVLPNLAMPAPKGFIVDGKQEKMLMTVGLMGYSPNAEGVNWFIDNVWPRFYVSHPDWTYVIAGGGASVGNVAKWNTTPGVEALGFVENLEALYERAGVVVAPINAGAGTCIKVIESALRGRKTFVTPVAARGLAEEDIRELGMEVFTDAASFLERFDVFWYGSNLKNQDGIKLAAERFNSFEKFYNQVKKLLRNK